MAPVVPGCLQLVFVLVPGPLLADVGVQGVPDVLEVVVGLVLGDPDLQVLDGVLPLGCQGCVPVGQVHLLVQEGA